MLYESNVCDQTRYPFGRLVGEAGKTATKSKPDNIMKTVTTGFIIPGILNRQHLEPGDKHVSKHFSFRKGTVLNSATAHCKVNGKEPTALPMSQ